MDTDTLRAPNHSMCTFSYPGLDSSICDSKGLMSAGSPMHEDSNYSGYSSVNGDNMKDNICRDYLRNVCNRGTSCKFRHPEGDEAKALGKKDLIFCHDFQNKECRRLNCRFIHCTKQEEEMYRSSGYIAEHIMESVSQKGAGQLISSIPVCKDSLKGECKRGGKCKFRHITAGQYHMETSSINSRRGQFENFESQFDGFGPCEPQPKRQAYENNFSFSCSNKLAMLAETQQLLPHHFRMLQEENVKLLQKIEELKKQVGDLTATNQFLREQNEQLRGLASKEWYMSANQNYYLPQ